MKSNERVWGDELTQSVGVTITPRLRPKHLYSRRDAMLYIMSKKHKHRRVIGCFPMFWLFSDDDDDDEHSPVQLVCVDAVLKC